MAQGGVKMGQNWPKYGQNGPKSGQNGSKQANVAQNGNTQTATVKNERNLRPNTPQGHSGWHRFAAFGPPGAKFGPQKGPKGPICCQIWNAFESIGSVVVSSARPWGSKGVKMAQYGPN